VGFAASGQALLVADVTNRGMVMTVIDLATGHREPWKRVLTESRIDELFTATPDLKYYAYSIPRYSSVLYLVENLR
jgi:hypothetical protein